MSEKPLCDKGRYQLGENMLIGKSCKSKSACSNATMNNAFKVRTGPQYRTGSHTATFLDKHPHPHRSLTSNSSKGRKWRTATVGWLQAGHLSDVQAS